MQTKFLATGGIMMLLLAGGLWYLRAPSISTSTQSAAALAAASSSAPMASTRPVPADCGQAPGAACVEYDNSRYHFSLFVSSLKTIHFYDEGGGAATITFENITDARGFQIFIVPYHEAQVSQQRFLEDDPSGVRENLTPVTIDGATGAAFESKDERLGDTYEVWFIHGGYLYEVTTLKGREQQMQQRLKYWQFTN